MSICILWPPKTEVNSNRQQEVRPVGSKESIRGAVEQHAGQSFDACMSSSLTKYCLCNFRPGARLTTRLSTKFLPGAKTVKLPFTAARGSRLLKYYEAERIFGVV